MKMGSRRNEVGTTCVSRWVHRSSDDGVLGPSANADGTDLMPTQAESITQLHHRSDRISRVLGK
jgi:hypothetical protein